MAAEAHASPHPRHWWVCRDGYVRTCRASTDTAWHKAGERTVPASLKWVFWQHHLEIPYLVKTCVPLSRDFVVILGGRVNCCEGSYLIYFKSSLLQVSPLLLENLFTTTILWPFLCIYIYICTYTYIHVCIKSIYFKQSPVSFSAQPDAHTTAMQKSQQLQTSSFPRVSGRLSSKSLLALIWDKGALSLFSWRVAMATRHKDISIAG